jgi:hypothetical protein
MKLGHSNLILVRYCTEFSGGFICIYAKSWKFASSSPDEVIEFFLVYLILSAAIGPGVHSASNVNEYQK